MKKWTIIFVLSFGIILFGQITVDNPEKPLNEEAGRVLKLEEVMRFSDNGQDFHFRYPTHLQLDKKGNIYLYNFFELLKFNSEGGKVYSILKRGLGPGEIDSRPQFLILEGFVLFHASKPPKVISYSLQGQMLSEKKIARKSISLLGESHGKIYFLEEDHSVLTNQTGIVEVPLNLNETTSGFGSFKKLDDFQYKWFWYSGFGSPRSNINYIEFKDRYFFITYTEEYKISRFNITDYRVDMVFNRKYERVKRPQPPKKKLPPGSISPPKQIYTYDIVTLLNVNGLLWVFTSTFDENQNRLIDVFDVDGVYVDSFYLQFPNKNRILNFSRRTLTYSKGNLYASEQDEEGEISIAKYRIFNQ